MAHGLVRIRPADGVTGAETVADLDPAAVSERAQKLWIVPPGGSLL